MKESGESKMPTKSEEQQGERIGRFRRKAIKVTVAQSAILETARSYQAEMPVQVIPLYRCGGRYAAERLAATSDWPPFARSGVDGFAVRSADVELATAEKPVSLRLIDSVAAGDRAVKAVLPGTAIRIMTGAMVPPEADAVVMLEQTEDAEAGASRGLWKGNKASNGGGARETVISVQVKHAIQQGQNIAQPGEELQTGAALTEPGMLLRPGHIALLGTFGYSSVPVFARPRVGIFATGSELLAVDERLEPGRIRDSNSAMLAAMVEQSGGEAVLMGRLPDELGAVRSALAEAADKVDMIVTTGGVSVGDYDVMAMLLRGLSRRSFETGGKRESSLDCIAALGQDQLLFDRVAMRPGSPTSAARFGGKLLFALSGNPGACFVGFELFVRPAMLALQGASHALPTVVQAELVAGFEKGSPHDRYVRARLLEREGRRFAEPLGFVKSSMMASIPAAEGLVLIPSGSKGAPAGQLVDVLLLPS
ncbi:molybdenum cofactor synthesis domain protein [Paenibacillus curdlanolyticus YK9]|uniref:Molybdopterin molybdenumtransferase n=1 Tax=Paenibacillus curdlanolyticus YK9 TaxID=717606 RepID=E0I6Y1_9BACL|nr:gephyrin-like molybdotransferase Glp [Paenibacillus curdlanolyticus]EFM11797.1 molybdenum cofactor synthesis domain protein [Paenibacillus curdlanolyticus YK9]